MNDGLRTRDRVIFGIVLPLAIMTLGLLVVMSFESGAAAAEFGSLGIMLGSIVVAPFVLLINGFVAFQKTDNAATCFRRGMVTPGLILVAAVIYQTGLWDAIA